MATPDKRTDKRTDKRAEKRAERPTRSRAAERNLDERPRGPRLDTPREPNRRLLSFGRGEDRFGVFAERFARFMGTARFLLYMSAFVVVWVALNLIGLYGLRWDPYPFILLNLFFSVQASYAAPLILLAQNRQEDRDRVIAEQDRHADAAAHADMEYLAREVASLRMALGEVATRDYLRSELRSLLTELEGREGGRPAEGTGANAERDQHDVPAAADHADPG